MRFLQVIDDKGERYLSTAAMITLLNNEIVKKTLVFNSQTIRIYTKRGKLPKPCFKLKGENFYSFGEIKKSIQAIKAKQR